MLLITDPSLLTDSVEAMVKEVRAKVEILREYAERDKRAIAVVEVRPFGDSD